MNDKVDYKIVSDPAEKKKLKQIIVEATHIMQQLDDKRESLKDLFKETSARFGIPVKLIKKVAATMYKSQYRNVCDESEHFELLYETLFPMDGEEVRERE